MGSTGRNNRRRGGVWDRRLHRLRMRYLHPALMQRRPVSITLSLASGAVGGSFFLVTAIGFVIRTEVNLRWVAAGLSMAFGASVLSLSLIGFRLTKPKFQLPREVGQSLIASAKPQRGVALYDIVTSDGSEFRRIAVLAGSYVLSRKLDPGQVMSARPSDAPIDS
jgi:hypothetical protein